MRGGPTRHGLTDLRAVQQVLSSSTHATSPSVSNKPAYERPKPPRLDATSLAPLAAPTPTPFKPCLASSTKKGKRAAQEMTSCLLGKGPAQGGSGGLLGAESKHSGRAYEKFFKELPEILLQL